MVEYVRTFPEREKMLLLAPIHVEEGRSLKKKIEILAKQGYSRVKVKEEVLRIDEADLEHADPENTFLVVDRIVKKMKKIFITVWLMPWKPHSLKEKANFSLKD